MENGDNALCLALRRWNLVIARLLLVAGATVDVGIGEYGVTVLMFAAVNNSLDFTRLLFEFRANPNVVNKNGGTALHFAAMEGHAAMTRLLVDHGAPAAFNLAASLTGIGSGPDGLGVGIVQ